jgi:predicted transcriptional regulator
MQVHLSPELESQLNRMAAEQGRNAESLVSEAVQRLVEEVSGHNEWFVREVEAGLSAADRGEFIEHDAVRTLIDSRYPG